MTDYDRFIIRHIPNDSLSAKGSKINSFAKRENFCAIKNGPIDWGVALNYEQPIRFLRWGGVKYVFYPHPFARPILIRKKAAAGEKILGSFFHKFEGFFC